MFFKIITKIWTASFCIVILAVIYVSFLLDNKIKLISTIDLKKAGAVEELLLILLGIFL